MGFVLELVLELVFEVVVHLLGAIFGPVGGRPRRRAGLRARGREALGLIRTSPRSEV